MKILHVITTLDVGGAEMHLLAQVRGQCARGNDVRVVYLKGHGSLAPDFRAAGAEQVVSIPANFGLFFALRTHLRWADVVHSHLLKADMATAVIATFAGKRKSLVASKHNDEQVLRKPLVSLVHGVVGGLPQRTIVLSDHVGRFIAEHGRVPLARQRRIYYGLDPRPFEEAAAQPRAKLDELRTGLGLARDDVVFICVARFAAQKAHDVLLRAFATANQRDPRIRLVLVGDDPFGDGRVRAESLASELGLIPRVVFAGIRRDVPQLLAASDVFVMASLWEGLGLVFLEAMATKLPVLATNVSAVPEVVLDGITGVLVPPSDPAALADAMVELARQPQRRNALGSAGHARVIEHFGLDRMIDATLEVYADLPALEAARRERR